MHWRLPLISWMTAVACVALLPGRSSAADWPTYRGDYARSGASAETIESSLGVSWTYRAPAAPQMAWSSAEGRVIEGKLIGHRIKDDDALHPVVAGGRVYFGSSVDHQLHCLDLQTGKTLWTFYTGGPIRLAPTVAGGRVYFGSDDGRAYCVDAETGRAVWELRAGPADEWLLARGEMISRWPIRTSMLVDGGVAYFGAGIFPHENVYLYAVNAGDGTVLWKQDHISAEDAGRNDLSPQGYLLASDGLLFVPSGGTLPAAFDRRTGKLVHKRTFPWRTTAGGVVGGTRGLLADGQLYASGPHHLIALEQQSGNIGFGWFAGRQMVVAGDDGFVTTGSAVARLNRLEYAVNSRRRHELELQVYNLNRRLSGAANAAELRQRIAAAQDELRQIADVGVVWQKPTQDDAALVAAANLVFVGGKQTVTAYSRQTGEAVWTAPVSGDARGLVPVAGRLLVSTTTGEIYCFAPGVAAEAAAAKDTPAGNEKPFPRDEWTAIYERAAEDILRATGVKGGFCLVVGAGEGRLAYELAVRSELKIYAVEADAERAAAAHRALARAGLYGHRVTIHHWDARDLPYSNYFADLVVSDALVRSGELGTDPAALARHIKPVGGVFWVGRPAGAPGEAISEERLTEWLKQTGLADAESRASDPDASSVRVTTIRAAEGWALLTRGPLPGAGNWTHQYGNPANTAASSDTRVKGGLGVLWYGDPGPGEMLNRHEGAVGPLAVNGRLFVQGETTILAHDAYNGRFLWKYENPEALRTGVFQNSNPGNLAASDDRLFHFVKDQCYELDAATGEVQAIHRLPAEKDDGRYEWGYVAVEGGVLFGTATMRQELEARQRRRGRVTQDATDAIFAIDLASGEHRWTYQGSSISHHTIAVGPERLFFIDSSITPEQRADLLRQDKSELEHLTGEARQIAEDRLKKADVRRAVAIDVPTGNVLWAEPVDVTDCSELGIGGGKLTLMYHDGVLVLGGANANGHYWSQFIRGDFSRRRLVVLSAGDGYKLWAKDANHLHRPIIVRGMIIAEPWAFDLKSGDQLTRAHPLTGEEVPWSIMRTGHHCGMPTGCESGMLLFRSGATAFYDLDSDAGVRHFAGHRLGCWINAIPANGLVLVPEASAGCVCLFSISSTIVLEPREPRRPWTIYSAVGGQTPVRQMALNLGAPGDRKAADGTLWLSYPRHKAYKETSLDVALDLKPRFARGGGFDAVNEDATPVAGTEVPWIYTSWARGLTRLVLPLLGADDPPARYDVELHFANCREAVSAEAKFDVRVQGETVLENVTLEPASDGEAAARVERVGGVAVSDRLRIELVPRAGEPVLCAVSVRRVE